MPKNVKKKVKIQAKKAVKKVATRKTVTKAAAKKIVAKKPVAKKVVAKKAVAKKVVQKVAVKAVSKPVAKAPVAKKVEAVAAKSVQTVAKTEVKQGAPHHKFVAPKMPVTGKVTYKVGHHVVYPTHGVGKIVAEETQMIGDIELRMLVISFEKDKMTLRVPVSRATAAGLRPVSSSDQIKKVFITLKGRARTSRGMWSRRAQEYEAKINSGNIFSIAEVVRDLHQNVDQSERSYSERMIYESALSRLVGELAASESTDHKTATDKLMKLLRGKVAAAAALKEAA